MCVDTHTQTHTLTKSVETTKQLWFDPAPVTGAPVTWPSLTMFLFINYNWKL